MPMNTRCAKWEKVKNMSILSPKSADEIIMPAILYQPSSDNTEYKSSHDCQVKLIQVHVKVVI